MSNIRAYYEGDYATAQTPADRARKDRLCFLFPSDFRGKRVLSVGCGPGVDIAFLAEANEVHGIDISEQALAVAKSRGIVPHQVDLNTVSRLPFASCSVDLVIATDILEHLFDPKMVLVEVRRVLKDAGEAILSVPNHFCWRQRLSILCGGNMVLPFHGAREWDYFHIRFFTLRGWEKLLAEAGFRVAERHYDRFVTVPRGLPPRIDRVIARRCPGLFSLHFLCRAVKR